MTAPDSLEPETYEEVYARLTDMDVVLTLRSQAVAPTDREFGFILVNPPLLRLAADRIEELSLKALRLRY